MIDNLISCGVSRRAANTLVTNVGARGLATVTVAELCAAGVPKRTAERVHATLLFARQMRACESGGQANDASDIAARLRPLIGHLRQEVFYVVCMDIRNNVIDAIEVARGTVSGVEVHPREVFRAAIRCAAAGIVLAHNHPSNDPTPSTEDVALTRKLTACGELLGVPVVDHVVVTDTSFRSIAEWMR